MRGAQMPRLLNHVCRTGRARRCVPVVGASVRSVDAQERRGRFVWFQPRLSCGTAGPGGGVTSFRREKHHRLNPVCRDLNAAPTVPTSKSNCRSGVPAKGDQSGSQLNGDSNGG